VTTTDSPSNAEPGTWTVDQLAHDHGLPVSTVRLYQTRGLLPAPRREGRVAYYDDEHRRRLRLIAQLQERGFSLASIKELLDGMAAGQSLPVVLGLGDAPATWLAEEPLALTLAELLDRLPGVEPTPELVERVARLGLVTLEGDGSVTVDSPAFLDIGSRLIGMGIPGDVVLDEYDHLRELTDDIAQRFTEVFRRHLWASFEDDGMPAARIPEMARSLEQLGPLAEAVVTMALRHSLQRAADDFLDEQAARLDIDFPRAATSRDRHAGLRQSPERA
jgi:DNA-binding transcriptional MerR regulator